MFFRFTYAPVKERGSRFTQTDEVWRCDKVIACIMSTLFLFALDQLDQTRLIGVLLDCLLRTIVPSHTYLTHQLWVCRLGSHLIAMVSFPQESERSGPKAPEAQRTRYGASYLCSPTSSGSAISSTIGFICIYIIILCSSHQVVSVRRGLSVPLHFRRHHPTWGFLCDVR